LLAPFVYHSDLVNGDITVPEGFETDFASVPRIPMAFLLTGDCSHAASVVHDYLCSLNIYSWDRMDAIFMEAMQVSKVPGWRNKMMGAGVWVHGLFRSQS
jgi:hypothetical protein